MCVFAPYNAWTVQLASKTTSVERPHVHTDQSEYPLYSQNNSYHVDYVYSRHSQVLSSPFVKTIFNTLQIKRFGILQKNN